MSETRRALVVGGAGGIGGAICRKLATDGYRVVVADFDLERAQGVRAELPGSAHEALRLDVTDEASIAAVFDAVEAGGPAAVLVVATGGPVVHLGQRVNVATMSQADWDRTVSLNLTGTFCCVRKFAQQRLSAPLEHGRIVLIGSGAGQVAGGGTDVAYGASKAGVIGLTRQAAFDLAPAGITVNNIAPGPVGTPEFFRNTTEPIRAAIAAVVPLKRLGTVEEVADLVAYVAAPQAAYITGATFDVNGGLHMH